MLYQYIREIYRALERQRPYFTYNRDASHAMIVVTAGFRYAQSNIDILSNRLDADVYGGLALMDAARKFLEKPDAKLRILLEQPLDDEHPLLGVMLEQKDHKDKVDIRQVPDEVQQLYDCNFMLMDEFGYRYEADRKECNASVMFYGDRLGTIRTLRKMFNTLHAGASPDPRTVPAE